MKRLVTLVLITLILCATAIAQNLDQSGRGRYLWYGHNQPYAGATVLKELPAGSSACAKANELVGVPVMNSTGEGMAVLSKLTDKAEVSVATDGRIFLCYCAQGYNQLFLDATPPVVKQQQVVTQTTPYQSQTATGTATVTVNMPAPLRCSKSNAPGPNNSLWLQEQCPNENPVLTQCLYNCNAPAPAPTATAPPAKEKDNRGWCERHPNWCTVAKVGGGFAAGVGVGRWIWKDGGYIWVTNQ